MKRLCSILGVSITLAFASALPASADDLAEGAELYVSQCKICHGDLAEEEVGFGEPFSSPPRIRLAMESVTASTRDFISQLIPAFGTRSASGFTGERLAFAPPFGPNLRGIVGRAAGTVEGYTYSETMLKTLKGMEWTEAALNVWITNPQAWVPGVYMYYKQEDPEIRRKIILYLKANP
ncbi:MAG: hypothetical protein JSU95_12225 [Betaproteobacteria bacterium]|nr:MAG: hypothetical protein JSU95_12225 [Betaproteobacteria bacterium]